MTDGRFANIPAIVMLHPVGGQRAGTTQATQVQDRGRDTVVKQGGVMIVYQGQTPAAAPEMTVMTNGHYASAMKGSPKVKNTGHLAM
ncbi:hypothetical protein DPMN_066937 [Dreissena polymorpha]|uniref:Uncharacterized protein n=1 Tax=Dreissena polymorpha TaxID=45954 RepID=A0A9D3YX72_DREPO|nr:hypothetical protein DPMN_066937 [Dreissena polymorpha]